MKKNFVLILLGFHLSAFSQIKDTLLVTKLKDAEWVKTYANSTKFKSIKFEDGSVLHIGDMMAFGRPSSYNQSYRQSNDIFGNTGQSVNNFSYIMLGRMIDVIVTGIKYLPETFKGKNAEIVEIKFIKNTKKAIIGDVILIFQNPWMDITVLNLDAALKFGELINPKAAITSDQALAELQKAKIKLDLGVITQEEYETIKKDLMKIIK